MNIKRTLLCAASGLCFGAAVAASEPIAADFKNLPGSVCTANHVNGAADQLGATVQWAWNGDTTNVLQVVCPILRDDVADETIEDLKVYVYDGSSSASVQCRCYKADADSTSYGYGSQANSSLGGTGFTTLTPWCPSTSYSPAGFYNVWCQLPAIATNSSRVVGYQWHEDI